MVLLVVLVAAVAGVWYVRFGPGALPGEVLVRNTGTTALRVSIMGERVVIEPGGTDRLRVQRGDQVEAWPADAPRDAGAATWTLERWGKVLEFREVGGEIEIAGEGLKVRK